MYFLPLKILLQESFLVVLFSLSTAGGAGECAAEFVN